MVAFYTSASFSLEVGSTNVPETMKCGDKNLALSAVAIRTATFFNIKIFVLAIYAAKKLAPIKDQYNQELPICFEITYLRDIDKKDADAAWELTFQQSSDYPYPELKNHLARLKGFTGPIKNERKHLFEFLPESTKFYENGIYKGEFKEKEFQKNFYSIWFGKNPPTKELKQQLLSGEFLKKSDSAR